MTPIKSQSVFGTCWAFAGWRQQRAACCGGEEPKAYDLSELQLAYGAYHTPETPRKGLEGDSLTVSTDDFLNIGGNNLLTTFISASWIGAVDEEANSEVAWSEADSSYVLPEEYYYNHNAVVLENAYWMMMKDTDTIKKAIMDYGAVASGMYYTVSYVNYKNGVYCYYNHDTKSTNHAVTIVGWDDNFSKENFATEAPGDGAWLIKNSYELIPEMTGICGYPTMIRPCPIPMLSWSSWKIPMRTIFISMTAVHTLSATAAAIMRLTCLPLMEKKR